MDKEQLTQRLSEELAVWKLRDSYYASYAVDQIQLLAEEYADDLWGMIHLNGLEKTLQHVRRTNRGFPSVRDIIEADRMVNRAELTSTDKLALPEFSDEHDKTPEELERNKRRLKILGQVALRIISKEEGERLQQELYNENNFKGRMAV
ncbi:MAG: hypothetical protein OEV64_00715 [Desulfobulbaceae bacterium]|nr:hypothetical protein [Desulfobulbaceae bacterium]